MKDNSRDNSVTTIGTTVGTTLTPLQKKGIEEEEKTLKNGMNENEGDLFSIHGIVARSEWTSSFLPQVFREFRLADYPTPTEEHRDARDAATEFVRRIRSGSMSSIVVFGRQGSGKTLLASCIWNELAPGIPDRSAYDDASAAGTADNLLFKSGAELAPWFRKDSDDESKTPAQKRHHVGSCLLAVLDDLDKFPSGEWSNELFRLADERFSRRSLATVVTMNVSPALLAARYGEAGASIVDRFSRAGALFVRLDERLKGLDTTPRSQLDEPSEPTPDA